MFLKKVTLENIKKYTGVHEFVFESESLVNTISGKNGSGKSTIFESIMLCQKAYFTNIEEMAETIVFDENMNFKYNVLHDKISKELAILSSSKESSITLNLGFKKEELPFVHSHTNDSSFVYDIELILNGRNKNGNTCEWSLEVKDDSGYDILNYFWNKTNPQNIIMFIEADKIVQENDFTYQQISMISNNKNRSLIVEFILNPKNIYNQMYNIMMNAYIFERLDPRTPPKNEFYKKSQEMFKSIFEDIEIKNFSSKYVENQFTLLAKKQTKFDIRNFSSGEKLIWYLLLVLNYVNKIGILIIDEPENHLHEQLAWKFISFLKNYIEDNGNDFKIGELFLITHSKNLIYNNFSVGNNFLIDDNLSKINRDDCENILRKCGISFTEDKILFVEGDTELGLLNDLCSAQNIKVKSLKSCNEIIKVYNSLTKVKELIYVPKFVFMIDKDTRTSEEINSLRSLDTSFFDSHVKFLPVHEIENFLLDENIFEESINKYLENFSKKRIKSEEIIKIMSDFANESLLDTKKKYLNNELDALVKKLSSKIDKKKIEVDTKGAFEQYINNTFSTDVLEKFVTELKDSYSSMENYYNDTQWNENWKSLCDGKRVFNQTCAKLAGQFGLRADVLKQMVEKTIKDKPKSEFKTFWNSLIDLYN